MGGGAVPRRGEEQDQDQDHEEEERYHGGGRVMPLLLLLVAVSMGRAREPAADWLADKSLGVAVGRCGLLLLLLLGQPVVTVVWALVSLPATALLRWAGVLGPAPELEELVRRCCCWGTTGGMGMGARGGLGVPGAVLRGRVAVVTGASAGIGLKTAQSLAALVGKWGKGGGSPRSS